MKTIINLFLLLICISCSSMSKTKVYSGIAGTLLGGFVGSVAGEALSPNNESDNFNKNLGAATGMLVGGLAGVYTGEKFYKEDPENFKGDPVEIEYKHERKSDDLIPLENASQINLSDIGINIDYAKSQGYKVPISDALDPSLIKDVKKQVVIKHKVPERKIKLKNGKTYILKETELIEHTYVD